MNRAAAVRADGTRERLAASNEVGPFAPLKSNLRPRSREEAMSR
jgi:hypothetical protein